MDNINDLVNEIANRLRRLGQRVSRLEESEYGAPPTVEGGAVFNESGADVDHRFEGDTDANLLFIDGSSDRIGVGTNSPTHRIDSVHSVAGANYMRVYNSNTAGYSGVYAVGDLGGVVYQVIGSTDAVTGWAGWGRLRADGGMNGLFTGTGGAKPLVFATSDTERVRILNGVTIGSPTGGDKGVGTLNAKAIYDDNTLLTDWVFDLHYDGRINEQDKHASPNGRLWNIEDTEQFAKDNRHLPTMPGREAWEEGGKRSLGELVTALWETVEQQQLQIFDLNQRIEKLSGGKNGKGN